MMMLLGRVHDVNCIVGACCGNRLLAKWAARLTDAWQTTIVTGQTFTRPNVQHMSAVSVQPLMATCHHVPAGYSWACHLITAAHAFR